MENYIPHLNSLIKINFGVNFNFASFVEDVYFCHNPNLGLATKVKVCEGVGQEWSLEVTFHVPRSVGECEGTIFHTAKWAPTLGVGVPLDSQIFKEQLQRSKPIGLKSSLYHLNILERRYLKKACMIHLNT